MLKSFGYAVALTLLATTSGLAGNLPFKASTSMQTIGNGFTIDKIGDGNASDLNGFATNETKGFIDFDFGRCVAIGEIAVWNDINPKPSSTTNQINGGIRKFELEFIDHNGKVVAKSPVMNMKQSASGTNLGVAQGYTWNSFGLQRKTVAQVRLWVHSAHWRPEVREILFMGEPTDCPGVSVNGNDDHSG